MRALLNLSAAVLCAAVLGGCASQTVTVREYYEPTESTSFKREDGLTVGALKAEAVKDGQPDWSAKTLSVISIGK